WQRFARRWATSTSRFIRPQASNLNNMQMPPILLQGLPVNYPACRIEMHRQRGRLRSAGICQSPRCHNGKMYRSRARGIHIHWTPGQNKTAAQRILVLEVGFWSEHAPTGKLAWKSSTILSRQPLPGAYRNCTVIAAWHGRNWSAALVHGTEDSRSGLRIEAR